MQKRIRIGERVIGEGQPLFIMAEAGVTCNYDLALTKELIDVVKESGADAIKLIFWFPEEILSDRSVTFTYETADGGKKTENMFAMLDRLRFTFEQWQELKAYADSRGIVVFSTVNSPSGIDYSERLGLPAYKLSSWDYNYFPLWRRIAALKKPMLIDTGPVTAIDVAKVMHLVREAGNDEVVLLHCFHTTDFAQMNMRAIPYMAAAFDVLTGFSSSGHDISMDITAVTLGAAVLETRLTLSHTLPGHHHAVSKEPRAFADYVKTMRDVQSSLGVFDLRPSREDLKGRAGNFRRIVAARDISSGETLTADMLECKRPASDGLSPEYLDLLLGRRVVRDIKADQPLRLEDV